MPFKYIALLLLYFNLFACSTTTPSSQQSSDTKYCSAISYGYKNVGTLAMDSIYEKCMNDKRHLRKQQREDAKKLAFFEFFVNLFLPTEH